MTFEKFEEKLLELVNLYNLHNEDSSDFDNKFGLKITSYHNLKVIEFYLCNQNNFSVTVSNENIQDCFKDVLKLVKTYGVTNKNKLENCVFVESSNEEDQGE